MIYPEKGENENAGRYRRGQEGRVDALQQIEVFWIEVKMIIRRSPALRSELPEWWLCTSSTERKLKPVSG